MKTCTCPPSIEEIDIGPQAKARWRGLLAGLGVVLFAGPLWGLLGTTISMIRAFNTISVGISSLPQTLATDIHIFLFAPMIEILVGLIGAAVIITTLFTTTFREPWFYRNSIFVGILWCIVAYPYGLFIGLPMVALFIFKRTEFRKQEAEQDAPSNR